MSYRVHPDNRYPNKTIDIVLLTANRKECSEKTIDYICDRVQHPDKIRLIVIDDGSTDGTKEMLDKKKEEGKVAIIIHNTEHQTLSAAYNMGFKHVKSDYFMMCQDDIRIPKLEQDIIIQLQDLMEKYPNYGGIGTRIERIPNMDWTLGNEDLAPARKSLSAYFRIQLKSDYEKMGMLNASKTWDDVNFLLRIREIGLEGAWAKNLWSSHKMGYAPNRNYKHKPRLWGFGHLTRMNQAIERKPYPRVDENTNVPLDGEKCYR